MIEALADADEAVMNKYLERRELIARPSSSAAIRKRTIAGEIVPVLCGSAFKNKGVQPLLDAVIDYLPAPTRRAAGQGRARERQGRRAHAVRRRAVLRARVQDHDRPVRRASSCSSASTRASLKSGDTVYNPTKGRKERIGRILQMHANKREDIKEVRAGDIAAAVGPQGQRPPATRSAIRRQPIMLETIDVPRAGDPRRRSSRRPRPTRRRWASRCKLAEEDPTFRVHTDEETGQTIISGMGELHLEIIVDRMKREFGVEANVGKPQVAYRETITKQVDRRRQVHPAVRWPRPVRPRLDQAGAERAGQGLRVRRRDQGRHRCRGSTSRRSRRACARRCRSGVLAGYPGGRRQGDAVRRLVPRRRLATRIAFKMAGVDGVQGRHAARRARCCSSRSWRSKWTTPEEFMGDVMGDLPSRAACIQGMDDLPTGKVIKARSAARARCSATRRRCARCRRGARRTRWNSSTTPRRRKSDRRGDQRGQCRKGRVDGGTHGQGRNSSGRSRT